ncbi:MoaD/ThiS family protein [Planctomicrobium piriforme]|uniref:Molybdopterin synthase sulfur carrier subunit n=1 Tax=Planctomicrobium piriforme TaxID=1576369 RepID=A0A1I3G3J7_9PLAN|nr:MoaD/ThiS family protein [Planctomicrobium piriforme]SFI18055.1 molybdopterin synthase catalytic subunit/molybdopterin synthase sulfur carrier subunit [Planctomicrobium piriforme]
MMVTVRLFAAAKDLAGADTLAVLLEEPATVFELKRQLGVVCPALIPLLPRLFVAVNENYVHDAAVIPQGASIACFPPVSGG